MSKYRFDRRAVKKQILELQDPQLSPAFVEVIDPPLILDTFLIEELDAGNLEGGLTDELFFECLADSPDYLAYEPFRQRLREWRAILIDVLAPEKERSQAKRQLKRVGEVLSKEKQGRPPKHQDLVFKVRHELQILETHLAPFIKEYRGIIPSKRKKLFIERFHYWSEYADLVKKHREVKELAKAIVCQRNGISRRELHYLLNPK